MITLVVTPISVFIGSLFGIEGVAFALTIAMVCLYYPSWRFLISTMIDVTFFDYIKSCFLIRIVNIKTLK
ncbi:hypothetical protein D3C79_985230 [compost metagenome]